jgi:hypothetical protein
VWLNAWVLGYGGPSIDMMVLLDDDPDTLDRKKSDFLVQGSDAGRSRESRGR